MGAGTKLAAVALEALREGEREDFVVGSSHLVVAIVAVHVFAVYINVADNIKDVVLL